MRVNRVVILMSVLSAGAWTGVSLGNAAPAPPIDEPAGAATQLVARPTSTTLGLGADGKPMKAVVADGSDVSSGTLRMLRTLRAFHKDVKTIHAKFHQVRKDEVFLKTVESEGEMWFKKPYLFRADYANPQPMITLIREKALYSYVPELKEVDYWPFDSEQNRDQAMHQLLLGFGQDVDEMVKLYQIHSSEDEAEPLKELKSAGLNPKNKTLFYFAPRPQYVDSSPFLKMKLYVDKATHLPEKIWYEDANDAAMTLTMKLIQPDAAMSEALFDTKAVFPAGVEYVDKRAAQ